MPRDPNKFKFGKTAAPNGGAPPQGQSYGQGYGQGGQGHTSSMPSLLSPNHHSGQVSDVGSWNGSVSPGPPPGISSANGNGQQMPSAQIQPVGPAPSLGGGTYAINRKLQAEAEAEKLGEGVGPEAYDMYGNARVTTEREDAGLLKNGADTVKGLIPSKEKVKTFFWGTRRRKMITLICMTATLAILSYLTAQIIEALNILNTEPDVGKLSVNNLCDANNIQATINAELRNPSSAGVNILPTEILFKKANGTTMAHIFLPQQVKISGGRSVLDTFINLQVKPEEMPHLRESLQDMIDGNEFAYQIEAPIRAHFPSLFIFPFTLSQTIKMDGVLDLNSLTGEYEYEDEEYEYEFETFDSITIEESEQPADFILARLGLKMWTKKSMEDTFIALDVPPINFALDIQGKPAAVGQTDSIYYGNEANKPDDLPDDIGVLSTYVSAGWGNVDGVNDGLRRFLDEEPLEAALRIQDPEDHPDLEPRGDCFLQALLNGVHFSTELDTSTLNEYEEEGDNSNSESGDGEDDSAPLASLASLEIANVEADTLIRTKFGLDITGALEQFGLRGIIPPINVNVNVSGSEPGNREELLSVALKSGAEIFEGQPLVNDIEVDFMLLSTNAILRSVDRISFGRQQFAAYIQPNPSRNKEENTLASALLSPVELELVINEGAGLNDTDDATGTGDSRRMLLRHRRHHHHPGLPNLDFEKELNNRHTSVIRKTPSSLADLFTFTSVASSTDKSRTLASTEVEQKFFLDVKSDDESADVSLNATGFGSDDVFGGTRIQWREFDFRILAFEDDGVGGGQMEEIMQLASSAFDSDAAVPELDFLFKAYDESSGTLLNSVVEDFTNNKPLKLGFKGTYDGNQIDETSSELERAEDALEGDRSGSSSGSGDSSGGFLELFHVELLSLDKAIVIRVHFGLDLSFEVEISLPKVAMAFASCDSNRDPLVSIIMFPWSFTTGIHRSVPVDIDIRPENAERLIDVFTGYRGGEVQALCLAGHPTEGNFLSDFIGSIGFDITLDPNSDDTAEYEPAGGGGGGETAQEEDDGPSLFGDSLGIEITSSDIDTCTQLGGLLNMDALKDLSNDTMGFGWGAIDLQVLLGSTEDQILSFKMGEGYIGPVNPYAIDTFGAPENNLPPIDIELCLLGPNPGDPIASSDTVRGALQSIVDGDALAITLNGTVTRRLGPEQKDSIDSSFSLPANLLDALSSGADSAQGGNNDAEYEESPLALQLVKLKSVDSSVFDISVSALMDSIGVNVTLPSFNLRLASKETPSVIDIDDLVDIGISISPFGAADDVPLEVNVALTFNNNWDNLFSFAGKFIEGEADAAIAHSVEPDVNFLSRIIPTFVISLDDDDSDGGTTSSEEAEVDPTLALAIVASSTANEVSLTFEASFLEDLDFEIEYPGLKIELNDTVVFGTLTIPERIGSERIGSKDSGTGTIEFSLGDEGSLNLADNFFGGTDIPVDFEIEDTTNNAFTTGEFTIPSNLVGSLGSSGDEGSGGEASQDEEESSFEIKYVALLGGDEVGGDVTLPCLFDGLCDNLVLSEGDSGFEPTGLTIGVTVGYDLSDLLSGIKWNFTLKSDAWATLGINAFDVGQVGLRASESRPMVVDSTDPSISVIVTVNIFEDMIMETRQTLTFFLDNADTVIQVGGADDKNHLSKMLRAVEQDIEFIDRPAPDPDAPPMVESFALSLVDTNQTTLSIGADIAANIDFGFDILLGDLYVEAHFGFDGIGGAASATRVVIATTDPNESPFVIEPSPSPQDISLIAGITYVDDEIIDSTAHKNVDELISRYIWGERIPLKANIDFTVPPLAGDLFGGEIGAFRLTTYITIPEQPASAGFIDDFAVDFGGTALSIFTFDLKVAANKVLFNTLDWPLMVSHFKYRILMSDTDGTDAANNCLTDLNPCSLDFLIAGNGCNGPWLNPTKRNIVENNGFVANGNPNQPISSVVDVNSGDQRGPDGNFIGSEGTGVTAIDINVNVETAARLVDEFMVKETLCADVADGVLYAVMRKDLYGCDDSTEGHQFQDLKCTFVARIRIQLVDYALGDKESCGTEVPVSLDQFSSMSDAGIDLPNPAFGSPMTWSGGEIKVIHDEQAIVSVTEPFRISFTIENSGCTEGYSLIFSRYFYIPPITESEGSYGCNGAGIGTLCIMGRAADCNRFGVTIGGSVSTFHRQSQALAGGRIDSGTRQLVFTYDAFYHRARLEFGSRYIDFDLNLAQMINRDYAILSIGGATTGCSFTITNFKYETPRTDSTNSIIEGDVPFPKAGEWSEFTFRARDSDGRNRGTGLNHWEVVFEDSSENPLTEGTDFEVNPKRGGGWQDNAGDDKGCPGDFDGNIFSADLIAGDVRNNCDGTYTVKYKINQPGRFIAKVKCVHEASSGPKQCENQGYSSTLTNQLFIRQNLQ